MGYDDIWKPPTSILIFIVGYDDIWKPPTFILLWDITILYGNPQPLSSILMWDITYNYIWKPPTSILDFIVGIYLYMALEFHFIVVFLNPISEVFHFFADFH